MFDVKDGKSTKSVPSKKYGVHLARFTHHSRQVLHASTKVDSRLTGMVVLDLRVVADAGQIHCDCSIFIMKAMCAISPVILTK